MRAYRSSTPGPWPLARTSVACVGGSSTVHMSAVRAPTADLGLIDDDPRHLVRRHRLAQTAGESKQPMQADAYLSRTPEVAWVAGMSHGAAIRTPPCARQGFRLRGSLDCGVSKMESLFPSARANPGLLAASGRLPAASGRCA